MRVISALFPKKLGIILPVDFGDGRNVSNLDRQTLDTALDSKTCSASAAMGRNNFSTSSSTDYRETYSEHNNNNNRAALGISSIIISSQQQQRGYYYSAQL